MTTRIGIDARKADDYGIGTYIRGLLRGLAELTASAAGNTSERFIVFKRAGTDLGPLGGAFETRDENAAGYSARELTALSRHAARERLDLYHATHYVLPVGLRCPAVVTIHDVLHLRFPEQLRHPAAIVYADRMLRRALDAAGVITVSRTTRDDLASAYQISPSRIDVIANGVDPRYFESLSSDRLAATLAGLGVSRPYVLFVGNPKPHKNIDTLVASFRIWRARRRSASPRLVLAGGHAGFDSLQETVRAFGVVADVDVLGYVPHESLPALYQGAELLAFPSLHEGFGLPVLEAMASGTPVLAADSPAVREVAGDAARYVPAADPSAWARELAALTAGDAARQTLRESGRRRAGDFSWLTCAQQTLAVYRRVLRGGAAERRQNDGSGFAWGAQLRRRLPR